MSRVVVIGGGVIGLCCAYELRRQGADVVLVDKGEPGAACSSGNTGWIVPAFGGPLPAPGLRRQTLAYLLKRDSPLYVNPAAVPGLASWLWGFWRRCNPRDYAAGFHALATLNTRTMALFDELAADGVEFEMHRQGLLFAFFTEAKLIQIKDDVVEMQAYGYRPATLLTPRELRAVEPGLRDEVIAGLLVEEERHVRPETLLAGLQKRLTDRGVEVRPGVAVVGFRRRGGAITTVVTRAGEIEGSQFLIAAGAWTTRLADAAGARVPVTAAKGYSITLTAPSLRLRHAVYLSEARIAVSSFEGAFRLGGTLELAGMDTRVNAVRVDAIRRAADRYLRGWRAGAGERTWAGLRPLAPDGLPVIGRVPDVDNLFVATGHGMLGITLAPATARALAEVMTLGKTGADLRPFDPARFARHPLAGRGADRPEAASPAQS